MVETFHIHLQGRVQGVGFRPFVYKLATAANIKGWVCNSSDGVHIRINSTYADAKTVLDACLHQKPDLAVITDSTLEEVAHEEFKSFQIRESQNGDVEISISPDFSMCTTCLGELNDDSNHRYGYPFITCTNCGPRYSIMKSLPYDRPNTSMDEFEMCDECSAEYNNPLDRRYYSQTNSCGTCGINLSFFDNKEVFSKDLKYTEILSLATEKLKNDFIVAVKGIGGFLLLCDANSEAAITQLRSRKHRPTKPFAVLFPSIEAVEGIFDMSAEEKNALQGAVSPIVLLSQKDRDRQLPPLVAPGLDRIGVMVPYAPVLAILSAQFGGPLIATSANLSGAPIVYEGDESRLFELADFVLSNNRPILFPQDDSVMQFSSQSRKGLILRRSRGLAPSVFATISDTEHKGDVLALGAEMKGAFGLSLQSNTYVSQYLGNLGHYENQVKYQEVLEGFMRLVKADPTEIIIDKHPGYFSNQFGKRLSEERQIPVKEVQHHEAHFAAVLAENKLLDSDRVLGVIWDGTGLGDDGKSWGGEFFDYSDHSFERIAHLSYFKNLANDRMAIDNRLCALSLAGTELSHELLDDFEESEWSFYTKSLLQPTMQTSSMGRVFDAVAFMAGLSKQNSYEGQAAMLLEQQAKDYLTKSANIRSYEFAFKGDDLCIRPAIEEMLFERKVGKSALIGARFHLTLVEMVREVALNGAYKLLAFSGGVFQNGLLVDLLIERLGMDFELYFHRELSSNDENIAFGQLAHAHYINSKRNINLKSAEQCV